jgi:hypothetical protein
LIFCASFTSLQLPRQLRQLGDIRRDPPRFVLVSSFAAERRLGSPLTLRAV